MKNCETRTPKFYVPKDCKECTKKDSCTTFEIYKNGQVQGFKNSIKEANKFFDNNLNSLIREIRASKTI